MAERVGIAEFAASFGSEIDSKGSLILNMNDPDSVWFVANGAVDIFLIERGAGGTEQSAPQPLMRVDAGHLLFSVVPHVEETTLELRAKGVQGTILRQLLVNELNKAQCPDLATLIDTWIVDLSAAMSRNFADQPVADLYVEAGHSSTTEAGMISSRRGVSWVPVPASTAGTDLYMGLVEIEGGGGKDMVFVPLTPASWITATPPHHLPQALSSADLEADGQLLDALSDFHGLVLAAEQMNRMLSIVDRANLDRASTESRRDSEERERQNLLNVTLDQHPDFGNGSALAKSLQIIGKHHQIDFVWPTRHSGVNPVPDLVDILDVSGVRARCVNLNRIAKWWVGDSGAMLAFRSSDNSPVALLPDALDRYRMVDPDANLSTRIHANNPDIVTGEAWIFFRPLVGRVDRPGQLLKIFGAGISPYLARYIATGLVSGLVMLLSSFALWLVVDWVLPRQEVDLLIVVVTGLALFAVIWALLHILQGMTLLRLEGRLASQIEAAFWDRMLRLPMDFLQQYPSADRAMRGMAFQRVRDSIQGVTANNILSAIFLFPSLIVIWLVDPVLGIITTAFGLLSLIVTVFLGLRQIRPSQQILQRSQTLTGILFQFIIGISKLRIAGAEGSAFAVWAENYRKQKLAEMDHGFRNAWVKAFVASLPLIAGAVVLAAVTFRSSETLSIGEFLLVYTVFMLFISSVIRLGSSFEAVTALAPEFAQIQPFLAKETEADAGQELVENLYGDIVFDRVSFRYDPTGPLILDNVSLSIDRGEFVAITGGSGSGKTTLFRLALKLAQPTSGAIYYDGRDLRHLNAHQLRRKIGVVPQKVTLCPQDIWDNIASDQHETSIERVWEAARISAIDQGIINMPMQLLTCLGDSQNVLSGGEAQRITTARAVARMPRILLLDEATNFLDNESQARVMQNLANLPMTRIMIAHRLSTLREADRIYVMDKGKLVEQGSYQELSAQDGVFRDLIRYQKA